MTTTSPVRHGLRESWEEYRSRTGGTRQQWREEGWRLLNWPGPGTPCRTPSTSTEPLCIPEVEDEARPRTS
jgi:hypothetical protein